MPNSIDLYVNMCLREIGLSSTMKAKGVNSRFYCLFEVKEA